MTYALPSILPILAQTNPLEHVLDKRILHVGGFWLLSNNLVMLLISAGLMLLIFPRITKAYIRREHVPTGTRNFFEAILIYIREEMARPVLGEETDRFLPFLWTLFFFILFNNLLGLLPWGVLTGWALRPLGLHPFGGTATANIWVTGALAVVAFFVWQVAGIRANGLGPYLKHYLGGAPVWLAPIMIPLEILGMFIKPFALAVRLFANMIGGHTVIAVLLMFTTMAFGAGVGAAFGWGVSIVVVLASVAMMCLEVFVAFLQTYIFVFLTAMFIGQLVVHEHKHTEGEGGHHDERRDPISGGDLTDGEELPIAPRQAGIHMAG